MTSVDTPSPLPESSLSNDAVLKVWRQQFKDEKCWTSKCTETLQQCPRLLFMFDRLEYTCALAFGEDPMQSDKDYYTSRIRIMINPMMMKCYHPDCQQKLSVSLKHPCNIKPYLDHLASHTDAVGDSLFKRFNAMHEDMFMTAQEYDAISPSPYYLLQPGPLISIPSRTMLKNFAIIRSLDVFYVFHWKNIMLREHYLSTQCMAFQEDDALVTMFLNYPNPVDDWMLWKTISTFSMKLFTSISGTALSLHRGKTNYPSDNLPRKGDKIVEYDRKQFLKEVNHPAPSLSNLMNHFPPVSYENKQYHQKFQILHLKILNNYKKSLALNFANVRRFPVVLGTDEQELNQGTFIENNLLHGLREKLDAGRIKTIGLKELPKFIQKKCPFLSSAREYRLTDLANAHSSNIYTEFIAGTMSTEDCESSLKKVIRHANSCEQCLMMNRQCVLMAIDKRCASCEELNLHCTSMVVFLVLWDMGSSHKTTSKQMVIITDKSTEDDFKNPGLVSIAFGGLHLAKSPTNFLRNNVLTFEGQNYGLHIIRALRNTPGPHSSSIANLKASVAGGKDRQSDELSYDTTGPIVQESLKEAKTYKCVRLPEPDVPYKVKSQFRIMCPTGVQCNQNGDVFILDSGASCVHAVERTSVGKVVLLGAYNNPSKNLHNQKSVITGSEVKFSNYLNDILIPTDTNDIYIVDSGKNEVIIVRQCVLANKLRSAYVNVWKKERIRSLCLFNGDIICVTSSDSGANVEIVNLNLPSIVDKNTALHVHGTTKKSFDLSTPIRYIFFIKPSLIGFISEERDVLVCSNPGDKTRKFKTVGIKTSCKPQIVDESVRYLPIETTEMLHLNVTLHKDTKEILTSTARYVVLPDIPLATNCFAVWGKTFHLLSNMNGFKLIEYGSLDFGLKFSKELNSFYRAISYTPRHGFALEKRKTLEECIQLAKPFVDLLSSMQKECERRFPNLKSFYGIHGAVWTQTFRCFETSLSAWTAVQKRLAYFDDSLSDKVNPHTLTNESPLEHSFGFTVEKSPGQLQNQHEYIHNKMKHEVDFQLRLTKVNFCQKLKVKLRDKSYQDLDEEKKSILSVKEIWSILLPRKSRSKVCEPSSSSHPNSSDERVLKQAFLLSKSVPRRSNRAKYKAESGFAPTMYINDEDDGKLLVGDLVMTRMDSGDLRKLIVVKELTLGNEKDSVLVKDEFSRQGHVLVSNLVKDRGLIFILPSSMYKLERNAIEMTEIGLQMFQECVDSISNSVNIMQKEVELPEFSEVSESAKTSCNAGSSNLSSGETSCQGVKRKQASQFDQVKDKNEDASDEFDGDDNRVADDSDNDDIITLRKRKKSATKVSIISDEESDDEEIIFETKMVTTALKMCNIVDLREEMWVLVNFSSEEVVDGNSGKYYIGKVIKITLNPAGAEVRCLERQFGIGVPQKLEKSWKWYSLDNIFVSPVVPELTGSKMWSYEY